MIAIAPRWPWLVALFAAGAVTAVWTAGSAPAALSASTMCSALLRAACERQQSCPGCAPVRVPCSAIVESEAPLCERRAAPGETFSAAAVDACVRAFAAQPCPMACATFQDPEACHQFDGLSR